MGTIASTNTQHDGVLQTTVAVPASLRQNRPGSKDCGHASNTVKLAVVIVIQQELVA